eukprot:4937849-Alexandrium_andersonii.AAC.1
MSASLVGSEMCIRDRAISERDHARRGRSGDGLGMVSGRSRDGLGTVSVSYTHLTLPTICSV